MLLFISFVGAASWCSNALWNFSSAAHLFLLKHGLILFENSSPESLLSTDWFSLKTAARSSPLKNRLILSLKITASPLQNTDWSLKQQPKKCSFKTWTDNSNSSPKIPSETWTNFLQIAALNAPWKHGLTSQMAAPKMLPEMWTDHSNSSPKIPLETCTDFLQTTA